MKKVLILMSCLLMAFSFTAMAGKKEDEVAYLLQNKDGSWAYEEIVQIPNITKEELFKRGKAWILENMKTGDNNIAFDDKEFTINNNGTMKIDSKTFFSWAITEGAFNFKFHVWLKDGKYRFRVDNVVAYLIVNANNALSPKTVLYSEMEEDDNKGTRYMKAQINDNLVPFVAAFKRGMASATTQAKNDW